MENNEKYITDRIQDHREEIDLDGLWEGVSPHIPKEKKRRKVGFWIFGGVALGVIIISTMWMTNVPTIAESDMLSINEVKEEDQYKEASKTTQNIVLSSNADPAIKEESEIQSSKRTEKEVKKFVNLKENNKNSILDVNTAELIANGNELDAKSTSLISTSESSIITTIKPINESNNQANQFVKSELKTDRQTGVYNSLFPLLNKGQQVEKERALMNPIALLNKDFMLLNNEEDRILNNIEVDVFDEKKSSLLVNRWSAFLFGGGGLSNRKLELKSEELRAERDRRDMSIEVVGEWNIEGGIGYRLTPKLKIMTGLNYSQIHEKELFQSDYFVDIEVESDNLIRKQNGTVYNEINTTNIQGRRISTEIRYNQIKFLQIPIRLSYDVLQIDKFAMSIGGLASYSITQKYSGFTSLSSSQESYDITLDEDNKFRTSGSLSYGLFLEGTRHLAAMTDLSFRLGYKQIRNINSEIYLIDQKYNSITFSTGISHRF